MRLLLGIVSLSFLLGLAACGCSCKKTAAPMAPGTATTPPGSTTPAPTPTGEPKLATVDLESSDTPEDTATGAGPKHKLRLVVTLTGEPPSTTDLGTFYGACNSEADAKELVKLKCWWAGSGDDITIFRDKDDLVVTDTSHDEEVAEPQQPREVARIKLPAGSQIKLAPMEGAPN